MEDSILIVDDEQSVIAAIRRSLIEEPYKIIAANNGLEGLNLLKQQKVKVVISDEKMPQMTGSEFLSIVKEEYPETIRIMLTGHANLIAIMKAVNSGEIYRFFTKPWDDIELKFAIRSAIEKYDLETENRRLLKTIKHQAIELKTLEIKHPGITKLERDDSGNLIIPMITDEELSEIIANCEKDSNWGI